MLSPFAKFIVAGCLWLPLGVFLSAVLRGFGFPTMHSLVVFLPVFTFGLPLAFACRSIYRLNRPRTAWVTFAVLAPVTVIATLVGGLLGPLGIAGYTIVLSLPAWLIYFVLSRRDKFR